MSQPSIIGAGLAGLIAAHAFPQLPIYEAAPGPRDDHKALLRFRTDAVAKLTGIEFRKVRVRKGIWFDGGFCMPDIQLANLYSLKCLDRLVSERSIWNIEAADRFVAPETFYEQLVESCASRISWNFSEMLGGATGPLISTAPLPVTLKARSFLPGIEFERAPITVLRLRVRKADVFQTIYYPSHDTPVYRASMTGDVMIIEARGDIEPSDVAMVGESFGIDLGLAESLGESAQRYGKIAPVDEAKRKHLIFQLTQSFGIFSLGRFATWRNILLDDVVDDIAVIKRLLRASDYDRQRAAY